MSSLLKTVSLIAFFALIIVSNGCKRQLKDSLILNFKTVSLNSRSVEPNRCLGFDPPFGGYGRKQQILWTRYYAH